MADLKTIRGRFKPSTAAEKEFYRQLKKVAQASAHVVERHVDGASIEDNQAMIAELVAYSRKLEPWARRQSERMLTEVLRSNKRAYAMKSKSINLALNLGVAETQVGMTAASLVFEQVDLIKSIPLEAGLRAQEIALKNVYAGTRAEPDPEVVRQLQEEMGMTEEVAINRAMLIARTETARSNAAINQSRATAVGSRHYRWHNSGDGAVRPSHKTYRGSKLQGRIFSWNEPPTLDDGMTGHPGTFPNCRCFAEPIFEDE
jgi:SPP1 gp7 family putative phage head morphogenesis protein